MKKFVRGEVYQGLLVAVFAEQVSLDRCILRRYIIGDMLDGTPKYLDYQGFSGVKVDLYDPCFCQPVTTHELELAKADIAKELARGN